MIGRLVSGGQTGVDRAALDAALELGIPCGGWCPRGRKAEDGTIPERYPMVETPFAGYSQKGPRAALPMSSLCRAQLTQFGVRVLAL